MRPKKMQFKLPILLIGLREVHGAARVPVDLLPEAVDPVGGQVRVVRDVEQLPEHTAELLEPGPPKTLSVDVAKTKTDPKEIVFSKECNHTFKNAFFWKNPITGNHNIVRNNISILERT